MRGASQPPHAASRDRGSSRLVAAHASTIQRGHDGTVSRKRWPPAASHPAASAPAIPPRSPDHRGGSATRVPFNSHRVLWRRHAFSYVLHGWHVVIAAAIRHAVARATVDRPAPGPRVSSAMRSVSPDDQYRRSPLRVNLPPIWSWPGGVPSLPWTGIPIDARLRQMARRVKLPIWTARGAGRELPVCLDRWGWVQRLAECRRCRLASDNAPKPLVRHAPSHGVAGHAGPPPVHLAPPAGRGP